MSRPLPSQQARLTCDFALCSEHQSESHASTLLSRPSLAGISIVSFRLVARSTIQALRTPLLCCVLQTRPLKHRPFLLPGPEATRSDGQHQPSWSPSASTTAQTSSGKYAAMRYRLETGHEIAPSYQLQPDPGEGSGQRHQPISPHLSHSTRDALCLSLPAYISHTTDPPDPLHSPHGSTLSHVHSMHFMFGQD